MVAGEGIELEYPRLYLGFLVPSSLHPGLRTGSAVFILYSFLNELLEVLALKII